MSTDDHRVLVGRIIRPHGLAGAVVVETITDRPETRFAPGAVLHTQGGGVLTVERFEATAKAPLLTFREVSGREEAETLRGTFLYIPAQERRSLQEEEFWPEDLVGLRVVDSAGVDLGKVQEVVLGFGQDRLLVATEHGTVTVPFVSEIVPLVDREGGRIVVDLPEGLMD